MSLTLLGQRNMVKLKLVPLRCFNYGDQQAGTVLDSLRACGGGGAEALWPLQPASQPRGRPPCEIPKYHTHAPAHGSKSLLADSKQTCSSVINRKKPACCGDKNTEANKQQGVIDSALVTAVDLHSVRLFLMFNWSHNSPVSLRRVGVQYILLEYVLW